MAEGKPRGAREWLRRGAMHLAQGDRDSLHRAVAEYERAAASFREKGDQHGEARARRGLEEAERRIVEDQRAFDEAWDAVRQAPIWEQWRLAARALHVPEGERFLDPIRFDFTPESLARLDRCYGQRWLRSASPGDRNALAIQAGFYLGEVLVRHAGARWTNAGELESCTVELELHRVPVFSEVRGMVEEGVLRLGERYAALTRHLG